MSQQSKRPEEMSAWERWELASFDPPKPAQPAPPPQEPAEPQIKLPTAEEIEAIYQQARDEGYRAGYVDGQKAAQDEAEHLVAIGRRMEEALTSLNTEVGEDILLLALDVARQVVRQSVRFKPEAIVTVIREALAQIPHQHATILLHPEDLALARSYLGDQLTHSGHRLQEDISLQRGDCRIEAGGTHVDATLASRWRRVVATLGAKLELESAEPTDRESDA